jgi:hypothetical protein
MRTSQTAPRTADARRRGNGVQKPVRPNVAWVPGEDLEQSEWVQWGRRLGAMSRVSNWWIGDWLQYGAARWGEKYSEAARITGCDVKTLRNIAYVARRFDLSRRRDKLTWTHHAELAALLPEQQDEWLERALALRLSPADLRLELRAAQRSLQSSSAEESSSPAEPSFGDPVSEVACPHCGGVIPLAELWGTSKLA